MKRKNRQQEKLLDYSRKQSYRFLSRRDIFMDSQPRMIWRLEDENGCGPFKLDPNNFNTKVSEIIKRRQRPLLYMKPNEDFDYAALEAIGFNDSFGRHLVQFGFKDLKQFYKWFTPQEYSELKKFGFKLRKVEALAMIVSDNQVIFVPRETRLKKLTLRKDDYGQYRIDRQ